ncbi:hypothetical protein M9H77_12635 [Catharanthus roseus]|uniref:Uncharacterized protein n=1 Tax=Catharanthus roseus TaxID=4058 RepID=A0ACC0BHX8_CATRO|nr:hypothetical protein M9H77_12635 [Catharanthus roseus]
MMEAKSKQEDYQFKLARGIHNFHHGDGNGVNAYGGSNHGHGNFISKRHNGVDNFSSYVKCNGHTSYDDYGEVVLKSYLSHVSIYGDLCAISFGVVSFLFSLMLLHACLLLLVLEDSLLYSGSMSDPCCHDFGVMNNTSIESIVVGVGLDGALFDILHDKCLGKFIENVGYVSSSFDTFM